jgi:hypothetical protein
LDKLPENFRNKFMKQIQIIAAAFLLAPLAHAETPAQMETQITALQVTITSQNATIAALQRQVTLIAQNPALGLGPFVTVDPKPEYNALGPNIVFHGANVHITNGSLNTTGVNGSLNTLGANGLGNLFIGYDLLPQTTNTPQRGGSHNLVLGDGHQFTSTGCILSGWENEVYAANSEAIGGVQNVIWDECSVAVGGYLNVNTRSGMAVTVGGAYGRVDYADFAVLVGGYHAPTATVQSQGIFGALNYP